MSLAKPVEGTAFAPQAPPLPEDLPTMYDLPSEDPEEPGLPDDFHYYQPQLLRETFRPPGYPGDQVYIGTDINLYYDPEHTERYKRPDWFAVLGQSRLYQKRDLRMSYVVWQEKLVPYLVVELLSPGTEDSDLGRTLWDLDKIPTKWVVYEQILKIPYYVVFSRHTHELQAYGRVSGSYKQLHLEDRRLWLPEAELGLGVWEGPYEGIAGKWLRCFDGEGHWLATNSERMDAERRRAAEQQRQAKHEKERADQERERADQERERAEQERERADQERERAEQERERADQEKERGEREKERTAKLAAQLKALGVKPEA
jgi:Uma2 family endonuclease